MLRVGSSSSSKGDDRVEVAMDCWKSWVVETDSAVADVGGVMYEGPLLIAGNVWRRGRASAGANFGSRGV